jgi:dipeptidyl aminopeptidase/acylaminoacyl peptidase
MTTQMLGKDEANRLTVMLLESEQLDDQVAALACVQHLRFVDPQRIGTAGGSVGGLEALLGAESRMVYRAAISISPGA